MRTTPKSLALAASAGAAFLWVCQVLYRHMTASPSAGASAPAVREAGPTIVKDRSWVTVRSAEPVASVSTQPRERRNSAPVAPPSADNTDATPAKLAMNAGPMNEDPSRSKILNSLLSSSTISCDVSAGQGAYWNGVGPQVHGISYQGGPFSFQAIDLQSQTATMVGDSGFTGGELAVRVTATDDGLYFVGFNRAGDLNIVTVYSAVDGAGHYRMVMSHHARLFNNESAQFYGACDTTLTQRSRSE